MGALWIRRAQAAVMIDKGKDICHLAPDGKWRDGSGEIFSQNRVDKPGPSA
jgi:hypothetical protein